MYVFGRYPTLIDCSLLIFQVLTLSNSIVFIIHSHPSLKG